MEGGKEANYWPGFVDALSNVVVTMVFVMVVLVIGLLYYSQNKAKEMMAAARHDTEERLAGGGKADPELAKKLAELMKENEALKKELTAAKAAKGATGATTSSASAAPGAAVGAGVETGGVKLQAGSVAKADVKVAEAEGKPGNTPAVAQIRGNQAAIEVNYPARTHELDKASLASLEAQFAAISERAKASGVELAAISEPLPYSEGRRLSYYRNLTLRNWLIDHGVPAAKIRARIAEGTTGRETGQVMISIPGDK